MLLFSLASHVLFLVSVFARLALGTAEVAHLGPRSTGNLCALINHGAAIVGGRLFFAEGSYSFENGDTLARESKLFSIDLTSDFNTTSYISNSEYTSISLPDGLADNDDSGVFFHDNSSVYFYDPISSNDQAWVYNVSTSSFSSSSVAVGGLNNLLGVGFTGAWTSNPATGKSYFTGAPSSALAKRSITSPLLEVLDTTSSTPQWLAGAGGGPLMSAGAMVYVRAGKAGILVAFGGVDPNDHSQFSSSTLGAYRSMDQIFVFDIDSQTWFNVTATGAGSSADIPTARISFCAVVSSAPDDTSFQITIYGGYNLHLSGATSTVHVLTLPTFQWIDVTPSGGEYGQGVGRQSHQCVVWNDAQMISLGGIIQGNSSDIGNLILNGCNSSHPPLLVLDTTTFEWRTSFSSDRSYSQPEAVYNVIGGDFRGLNTNHRAPSSGFNDTALSSIFSQTVARVSQPTSFPSSITTTTTTPTTTATTSSASNSKSSTTASPNGPTSSPKYFIIAVVIVPLVFIGLISALIYTEVKRYRKRHSDDYVADGFSKPELPGSTPNNAGNNPEGFYAPKRADTVLAEMDGQVVHEIPERETHVELPVESNQNVRPIHA